MCSNLDSQMFPENLNDFINLLKPQSLIDFMDVRMYNNP